MRDGEGGDTASDTSFQRARAKALSFLLGGDREGLGKKKEGILW